MLLTVSLSSLIDLSRGLTLTRSETCERNWYGTGPFCKGECPEGWLEIWRSELKQYSCIGPADGYNQITYTGCEDGYGGACIFGSKALCERNCYEDGQGVFVNTGDRV
jgi:hypothetical protein